MPRHRQYETSISFTSPTVDPVDDAARISPDFFHPVCGTVEMTEAVLYQSDIESTPMLIYFPWHYLGCQFKVVGRRPRQEKATFSRPASDHRIILLAKTNQGFVADLFVIREVTNLDEQRRQKVPTPVIGWIDLISLLQIR